MSDAVLLLNTIVKTYYQGATHSKCCAASI